MFKCRFMFEMAIMPGVNSTLVILHWFLAQSALGGSRNRKSRSQDCLGRSRRRTGGVSRRAAEKGCASRPLGGKSSTRNESGWLTPGPGGPTGRARPVPLESMKHKYTRAGLYLTGGTEQYRTSTFHDIVEHEPHMYTCNRWTKGDELRWPSTSDWQIDWDLPYGRTRP